MQTGSPVIPCLSYVDAPAAIDWLCKVFGFERHLVVPDDHGGILHAQLSLGSGMVMLGSRRTNNPYGKLIKQPSEIGGAQTQTTCMTVGDADAVYQKVKEAGVEIVLEIEDASYGGRGFTCRDLEGHVWSIGTYNPWGGA